MRKVNRILEKRVVMKLELLLRKLSDFFSLTILDIEDEIVLTGSNIKIKLDGKILQVETQEGKLEIPEEQIEDFNFFSRTKHCTIKLRNGVMRIYPEGERFRFFIKLNKINKK